MLIWVLGLPLFIFFTLHQNSSLLDKLAVKTKFGLLYNGFTRRSYYWEIVTLVRKEVVAAISVFLIQRGTVTQSMLLLLTLLFFVLLTLRFAPY